MIIRKINIIRETVNNNYGKYKIIFDEIDLIILDFNEDYNDLEILGCEGSIYLDLDYFDEEAFLESPNEYIKEISYDSDMSSMGLFF